MGFNTYEEKIKIMNGLKFLLFVCFQASIICYSNAQNIKDVVRDSLWLYEAGPNEAIDEINVWCYDLIKDCYIEDIGDYYTIKEKHLFSICSIRRASSNVFHHLLIIIDGKYKIVNMRCPLDEIIVVVEEFSPYKKLSASKRHLLWHTIIKLHYDNQVIWNKSFFESYELLRKQ